MSPSPFDLGVRDLIRLGAALEHQLRALPAVLKALGDLGDAPDVRLARLAECREQATDAWVAHEQTLGALTRERRRGKAWREAAITWLGKVRALLVVAARTGLSPAVIAHLRAAIPDDTRSIVRTAAAVRGLAHAASTTPLTTHPALAAALADAGPLIVDLAAYEADLNREEMGSRQAAQDGSRTYRALQQELRLLYAEWTAANRLDPTLPKPDLKVAQEAQAGRKQRRRNSGLTV